MNQAREKRMERNPSGIGFKLMSLGFKFRDIIRPRKNVLKDAGIKPGSHVLDFGCGPGGYILPLAKILGKSGKIYALDVNPQAIDSVKALVARKGLANVETIISDCATGLPDASIDVILLYDVFHTFSAPGTILAELKRVLNPKGILSFNDHHMREDDILSGMTGNGFFRLLRKGARTYSFVKQ